MGRDPIHATTNGIAMTKYACTSPPPVCSSGNVPSARYSPAKSSSPANAARSHTTTASTAHSPASMPVTHRRSMRPCVARLLDQQRQQRQRPSEALQMPKAVVAAVVADERVLIERRQRQQTDHGAREERHGKQSDRPPGAARQRRPRHVGPRPQEPHGERHHHEQIEFIDEDPAGPRGEVEQRQQRENGRQADAGMTPQHDRIRCRAPARARRRRAGSRRARQPQRTAAATRARLVPFPSTRQVHGLRLAGASDCSAGGRGSPCNAHLCICLASR